MSTCFFIGHRDTPDNILPSLSAAIEVRITEDSVDPFVAGNYGQFDLLAAQAVRKAKKHHPDILLFYLRPYHPAERSFTPAGFDGSFYPPGMETVPQKLAIVRVNRYMVDNSQFLIAYARYTVSHNSIILDFFAGSGTTAQAVMEYNGVLCGIRTTNCISTIRNLPLGR
jgi:hypothetical protein